MTFLGFYKYISIRQIELAAYFQRPTVVILHIFRHYIVTLNENINDKEKPMSDWDAYDPPQSVNDAFAKVLEDYLERTNEAEQLAEQISVLKDQILFTVPEEIGEQVMEAGSYMVTVNRNELWKWDADAVEAMIADQTIPPHVTRKYSIDKKRFQQLDDKEQATYMHALTRKPGAPRIAVAKKGL